MLIQLFSDPKKGITAEVTSCKSLFLQFGVIIYACAKVLLLKIA